MKQLLMKVSVCMIVMIMLVSITPMTSHATELLPPENFKAEITDSNYVSLTWDKVTPAWEYNIYRSKKPDLSGAILIGPLDSEVTSYIDYTVEPGNTYYYFIKTYYNDDSSELSAPAHIRVPIPMGTPYQLAVERIKNKELKVSWMASENATTYKVYFSKEELGLYEFLEETDQLSVAHSNLDPDTTYYYKVYPANGEDVGMPAGPVSGTTLFDSYQIDSSAGSGGSISPKDKVSVKEGTSQRFTFTPDAGHVIDNVFVNGKEVDVTGSHYEFTNVQANQTIHVTFTSKTSADKSGEDQDGSGNKNPGVSSQGADKIVATGDDNMISLLTVTGLIAAVTITVLLADRRRKIKN